MPAGFTRVKWLGVLLGLIPHFVCAQPAAALRPVLFYNAETGPYLETNLTVLGNSVSREFVDGRYRNSVTVNLRVLQDTTIVRAKKYNLHGPYFVDSTSAPAFIDCQRFPLPNGEYRLEMELTDAAGTTGKPLLIRSDLDVSFNGGLLESSYIQPLESFKKSASGGPLTKSGFDLVPFNADFYSEASPQLSFYYELYNASKVLGEKAPFIFEYFLQTASDSVRLGSYSGFRRVTAATVNPLLATLNINTLGTGDYALVIRVRDEKGQIRKADKYYFSRRNRNVDIQVLSRLNEEERIAAFVGPTRNADTLQVGIAVGRREQPEPGSQSFQRRLHVLVQVDLVARLLHVDSGHRLLRWLHPEHHVLSDREHRHQHEVLVDHPDACVDSVAGVREVPDRAIDDDITLVGRVEAVEDVHQGRLPCSVLAEEPKDLTRLDCHVDRVVGYHTRKSLGDIAKLELQNRQP